MFTLAIIRLLFADGDHWNRFAGIETKIWTAMNVVEMTQRVGTDQSQNPIPASRVVRDSRSDGGD